MKFISVKSWEEFQHYKDRSPPWIKLYHNLLSDYAFMQLPERAQRHLMLIWLVASRHNNRIPCDLPYIRRAIHAKSPIDFDLLFSTGFLIEVDVADDASPVLDVRYHDASSNGAECLRDASPPRARTRARERQRESTETEYKPPSTPEARSVIRNPLEERLTADADRRAVMELLDQVPSESRHHWVAEMVASLDGMPGHHSLTPAQLGRAVRDYVANGAARHPNLRQFRRYLEGAKNESARRPAVHGGKPTAAEQSLINSAIALKDVIS